ncbi:amidohydrolase family protein [Levilactobacillus suantsaiihabitans]|uniref:N-acyl-D-amino-acid deacylase n=1 Tax=Levilactobacillus suantsaiihabitans TaxID=2487722 RepID=A0A4Z0J6X1_9LACO|nr:amidohydrolase family protein [Levilactobacillus suantsaiihabitans]TGD18281.1 N-acyl-D-amino-acid deacylase [Levilactobacillus suantsaiihabitans]
MDILFKQVRLNDNESLKDVAIDNGKIVKIAPEINEPADKVIAGDGHVLIPGLVESHIHLDKALISNRVHNQSGTLKEAIAVTAKAKPTFTREDIYARAKKALEMEIEHGVTSMRTHAEFSPEAGFDGFKTILQLKEEYKDMLDMQVVAFPQDGIFKLPGMTKMMDEAMQMGADVVGGIPYVDPDPKQHIDYIFELAKKYNKDVDFHQDFFDDADKLTVQYIAEKTIQEHWEGRVTVGHETALAAVPPEKLKPIIELLHKAQVNVISLPETDLHLGGRTDTYNVRRCVTPIRKLRDGGVNVALSTNNIRNPFTPFGNGDIMQVGFLAVPVAHLGGLDDLPTVLDMLTNNPAKILHLPAYGVQEGDDADLVLLDTKVKNDAVIDIPDRLYVLKNGRITVTTERKVSVFRGNTVGVK